jgi:ankyrin repeat protein
MIRPDELKKDELLLWSAGKGTDVWDLFCACIAGDLGWVTRLVAADPSLVRAHYEYRTPLSFAVRENRLDVAAFLLDHDADPFGVGGDLVEAARDRGYPEMEELLTSRYASLHDASSKGEAVAAAIRERDPEKVRRLLDEAPELLHAGDARSSQPIHWAVMTRQIDVIDDLLRRGANIDARRQDGARPVELTNGDYFFRGWRDVPGELAPAPADVLAHLLARGAYCDIWTAAHLGDLARVRALLDEDPSLVNRVADYGSTGAPLVKAAARGHMDVVRLLLERGADPNLREEGMAPHGRALYAAVYNRHVEIARLLLEHGAYPNPEVESSADALSIAIMNSDTAMIDLLASYGATWQIPVQLAPEPPSS